MKSSAPWNGMSRNRVPFIACVLIEPNSSEYPSGRARATAAEPTLPEAPERFSTTTGWPRDRCKGSATARARMSVEPPGAQGTTMVTGRLGYRSCAWRETGAVEAPTATESAARRVSPPVRAMLWNSSPEPHAEDPPTPPGSPNRRRSSRSIAAPALAAQRDVQVVAVPQRRCNTLMMEGVD